MSVGLAREKRALHDGIFFAFVEIGPIIPKHRVDRLPHIFAPTDLVALDTRDWH
jgi:hypothetical protein